MRKARENVLNKLDIVSMAITQLKREGKEDNWTSVDFWKRFLDIRDYIKGLNHRKLQEIIKK